jgi:hypothetical protein
MDKVQPREGLVCPPGASWDGRGVYGDTGRSLLSFSLSKA